VKNPKAKILIVDDEPIKRSVMDERLTDKGYQVVSVANPLEAEPHLKKERFDVVLTDLRMPGQDGISFLRELKSRREDQAVIVMTAYGTVGTALEAMKLGAFDYLQKPFSTEELLLKLDKLFRYQQIARENETLRRELAVWKEEPRLIGRSESIRKILARIHSVGGTDSSILIEGESGTGKELAARVIHQVSFRASGPFIPVACAALPRELVETELFGHEQGAFTGASRRRIGRFELAHAGTLFLDDVDDMPPEVQVKLLRVLQEQAFERVGGEHVIRINVRVMAATKHSLPKMIAAGRFREDLYYRLNVIPLRMPPLRDRLEDIPLLVDHFLEQIALKLNRPKPSITPSAVAKLQRYRWPGNVRELQHLLERLVALVEKEEISDEDIPELSPRHDARSLVSLALDQVDSVNMSDVISQVETSIIRWALKRSKGNLAQAAAVLRIPRSTLQYKVNKLEEDARREEP